MNRKKTEGLKNHLCKELIGIEMRFYKASLTLLKSFLQPNLEK
jgi:hypothetical protein